MNRPAHQIRGTKTADPPRHPARSSHTDTRRVRTVMLRGVGLVVAMVEDDTVDVSIVIPARDCQPYLDRCLTSALVQRVATEIVVIDDGSTDGTTELLGLYAEYHRDCVKVIRLEGS